MYQGLSLVVDVGDYPGEVLLELGEALVQFICGDDNLIAGIDSCLKLLFYVA